MGLISELSAIGIKPLLLEHQVKYVHYSDTIFHREPYLKYAPIDENRATIITCQESRDFLYNMGIQVEIISTISHSNDGVAVILDDGNCCVGDLDQSKRIQQAKVCPYLLRNAIIDRPNQAWSIDFAS